MISDVIVGKPSKALNLVYVIFGYFLASFIISPLELSFEQKLSLVVIAGGIFGTFLFYIKPVERFILLLLVLSRTNKMEFYSEPGRKIVYKKTILFNSPMLAEERARINGAFFFSVSILLSGRLLELISLYIPFEVLAIISALMMFIAVWEGFDLVKEKIPALRWYYFFSYSGRPFTEDLRNSIERKDWIEVHEIISKDLQTGSIYATAGSLCLICKTIVESNGMYCPKCGQKLLTHCKSCHAALVVEETKEFPNYCLRCGKPVT